MKRFIAMMLVVLAVVSLTACDSQDYEKANSLLEQGKYDEARAIFVELGDYEDSALLIKVCDYEKACDLMENNAPAEAAELFAALGEYKDCVERLAQCRTMEIDALVQGTWVDKEFAAYNILRYFRFDNGRIKAEMTIDGKDSLANEGDYRIDAENQTIYVCYDYTLTTSGKVPNTKEIALFTYTYENGVLEMKTDGSKQNLVKE